MNGSGVKLSSNPTAAAAARMSASDVLPQGLPAPSGGAGLEAAPPHGSSPKPLGPAAAGAAVSDTAQGSEAGCRATQLVKQSEACTMPAS